MSASRPIAFLVCLFCAYSVLSQTVPAAEAKPVSNQEMMKKVSFMVGQWQGEGWMSIRGQRSSFTSSETVQAKLDGSILVIEGLHKSKPSVAGEEPRVVHNAFAIISYDDHSSTYRFHSYLAGGAAGDFDGKVEDGTFVWSMTYPGIKIRYTIALNEKGEWHEVGESSADGNDWNKTFEMTLHKVSK